VSSPCRRLFVGLIFLPFLAQPVRTRAEILLPIEIVGATPTERSVTYALETPAAATHLELLLHRPAYQDSPVNPGRGAKASVRINEHPWIDLTDDQVTLEASAAAVGGLGGGHRSVRLSLPLPGPALALNTLRFRFNGTDGFTSGYRVLDLAFSAGAFGPRLASPTLVRQDDPATWTAPAPNSSAALSGAALWSGARLIESPLAPERPLAATCASCHADDGRDLRYFRFSRASLVARSRFHGLSEEDGQRIADYILSRTTPAPASARPWHPPYQPGPGLDTRPVSQWAAGAGLDAVLTHDDDLREQLFPGGSFRLLTPTATLNVREQAVSLQFPDWNDWLPEIAPEDIWGAFFTDSLIDPSDGDTRGDLMGHYRALQHALETTGPNTLVAQGRLGTLIDAFVNTGIIYFLDLRYRAGLERLPPGISAEQATRSLRHWTVIKLWALLQRHGLEDRAPDLYGAKGEVRAWPGLARSVFDLAPHLSTENKERFTHQTSLTGKFASTAWYQLQMTLNSGHRSGIAIRPVDWNYQPNHINDLQLRGGPAQPYRALQTWAKLVQSFSGPGNSTASGAPRHPAALIRQAHPGRWIAYSVFDALEPWDRARVLGAGLDTWLDAVAAVPTAAWPRGLDTDEAWEPADYVPKPVVNSLQAAHHRQLWADVFHAAVRHYIDAGVPLASIERMIAWGESMWPLGDWSTHRTRLASRPTSYAAWVDRIDWPTTLGAAAREPAADPDGDGLGNALERALGLHPLRPDSGPVPSIRSEWWPAGGGPRTVTFSLPDPDPGLRYVLQRSTDLATWTDHPAPPDLARDHASGLIELRWTLPNSPAAGRHFLRLRIGP
jgi:cytochrome c553